MGRLFLIPRQQTGFIREMNDCCLHRQVQKGRAASLAALPFSGKQVGSDIASSEGIGDFFRHGNDRLFPLLHPAADHAVRSGHGDIGGG